MIHYTARMTQKMQKQIIWSKNPLVLFYYTPLGTFPPSLDI